MISTISRSSKKFCILKSTPFPKKDVINIMIGGGSGNISYNFLPMLCSGLVFGDKQKIALTILDRPESMPITLGNMLELEESCFPLLTQLKEEINPVKAVKDADVCIFLGSAYMLFTNKPRINRTIPIA